MEAAVAAQSMFRAMKADSDGYPTTGSSSRTLGVRIDGPSRDILVALDRTVSPGTGGMSVALSVAGPRRVFNLTNHPNFGLPNSAIGNPSVGIITTTINRERQNQLALKLYF